MSATEHDDMNRPRWIGGGPFDGSEYIEVTSFFDSEEGERLWSVMLCSDAGQIDRLAVCTGKWTAEELAATARAKLAVLLREWAEQAEETGQ